MLSAQVRSLWTEPRSEPAPPRDRRDLALVAALLAWTVLEVVLAGGGTWWPVTLLVGVVVALSLRWRRQRPLACVAVVFGMLIVVEVATIAAGVTSPLPWSVGGVLLLPYALFRWGSGREATAGLGVVVAWLVATHIATPTTLPDVVAAYAFFLLSAALGAAVRFRASGRIRELDQARLRERDRIARELHDTVAHHVSAIAIQAQAGRALATSDPGRAVEVLGVIEAAATRTLGEMRAMVGQLRDGPQADLHPQPGVADIERLAAAVDGPPHVEVTRTGPLDDLSPTVATALYRLAQESITNAVRHARHATCVRVRLDGHDDHVSLTVRDDGDPVPAAPDGHGFGLVGMRERTALLGGSFEAGPDTAGGWTVAAVIPKRSPRP